MPVPPPRRVATNAPLAGRIGRTNALPAKSVPGAKGIAPAKTGTNVLAGTNAVAEAAGTNAWSFSNLNARFQELRKNPMFFAGAAVLVCVILAAVLVVSTLLRRRRAARKPAGVVAVSAGRTAPKAGAKIHTCNVLQVAEDGRRLWNFDAHSRGFTLNREHKGIIGEKLPQYLVARDWRALFQKKMNVAWLPPEHVFLKVIDLPRSTFQETLSMVELQVEKLSPMPVTQVVWSVQVLPQATGNLDTVIVTIVSRTIVEEFLGKLEGEGYLADRLELPLLDQLQMTPPKADGAFVYPGPVAGKDRALVAWWVDGVLKNLDLAALPPDDRVANLREQLTQMTWAGELEGWLAGNPRWYLVADAEVAAEWEPALRQALEGPVEVIAPLAVGDLAARTASRASKADAGASLMPPEFAARYQQQFVDRLWMRGLGAVFGLYVVGVLIYFVALNVASYRTQKVERYVAGLGGQYTNALQLKAQSRILQDRQDLKFAALDCWATVSRLLPEGVTLDSMNFSDGKRLTLMGSASSDQATALIDFEMALRKATVNGQPLFDPFSGNNVSWQGSATIVWNLALELKRTEAP